MYLMCKIFCILLGPGLIIFYTANEMWIHLIKLSIYASVGFVLSYFEIFDVIKFMWNEEKIIKLLEDETDSLH